MRVTGNTRGSGAQRSVSIRDVATAAGVSHQTVSRVINGHPSVRASTRERVEAAIAELGFRRSATAHALASGRTRAVTVLTANTTHYGHAAILQGVEEAARAASFAVGISVLDSDDPRVVRDALDRATDAGGGLILIAYDRPGVRALHLAPEGVPLVAAVETPAAPPAAGSPWVWTDDRTAAREATEHLLALGHRTVHYLAIPSTTDSDGGAQRTAGWREALTRAGAVVPEPVEAGWTPAGGYAAGRRLTEDPAVTAVLCGNDDLAIGMLRALREAGREVPGDVSVAGFDDAPHSAFLTPALTTVRLDFTGVGRACFALLHGLVEQGDPISPHPVATPRLIVRESTGPAPGSR
ncbi:LacI family DNA-binding transcriptional regulator [Streptomyces litchfieldiae]|uniref:LacI family DNA-binding transcriptional regulator n=1 Tax=Streptomyces litchfieldiae TaxID=3075543 RepID=A0ABU2MSP1_9ACTN|nr:LacI family DNA-binding transcriptional regulator [Streptomyces sp. DSM 44938]MDT0344412.1 LacI family DNA-binding transcriptional regulator [Streptomyces sp. DSM 44938]